MQSRVRDRGLRVFQDNMVAKFTTYKQRLTELEALKQRVDDLERHIDRGGGQELGVSR